MEKKESWAVAMDFTKVDSIVLRYTSFLSTLFQPEKIHFIHVIKEMEDSSFLSQETLDNFRHQLVEEKKLEIKSRVDKFFKDSTISYECHIASGTPFEEIINVVLRNYIDLVIVARKEKLGGSGVLSDRLSENLPCNFLLVPEKSEIKLKNILVTTDFSPHSTLAMMKASEFQLRDASIQILAYHSYHVPVGYAKSDKSFEEFVDLMKNHAGLEMKTWLKGQKSITKLDTVLELKDSESMANQIIQVAKKNKIDMIIIGSRGQTKSSFALLGSNTMKLMRANEGIPMLIVKLEEENKSYLASIGKIQKK